MPTRTRFFLPLLALAALPLLFAACTGASGGSGGGSSDRVVVESPIEELDVLMRESSPVQYAAVITSGLPSGCAEFDKAVITGRDGTTITIRVTHTMPADENTACTMIYGYHESVVELGTDFVSGTQYTLKVNDEETTFTAQ